MKPRKPKRKNPSASLVHGPITFEGSDRVLLGLWKPGTPIAQFYAETMEALAEYRRAEARKARAKPRKSKRRPKDEVE